MMQDRFWQGEKMFTLGVLVLLTGAFMPLWRSLQGVDLAAAEGDPFQQVVWFAVYSVVAFLLLVRWRSIVLPAINALPLWPLMLFIFISAGWSAVPDLTLRRGLTLLGTTAVGLYVVSRYDPEEQLELLSWALVVVCAASLLSSLFVPAYGISPEPHLGDWRGIFTDKNSLGRVATLTAVCFSLRWNSARRHIPYIAGLGLALLLVVLSHSSTAVVVLLSSWLIYLLLVSLLSRRSSLIPLGLVVGGLVLAFAGKVWGVFDVLSFGLDLLGKSAHLTGRTYLWESVLKMIEQRPWLGYGYDGFWLGMSGPSARVWLENPWSPPHAHNGFLDTWLELGLVGLGLLGLSAAFIVSRLLSLFSRSTSAAARWPLMFMIFVALYNLTENTILARNSIFWVLYVICACLPVGRLTGGESDTASAEDISPNA